MHIRSGSHMHMRPSTFRANGRQAGARIVGRSQFFEVDAPDSPPALRPSARPSDHATVSASLPAWEAAKGGDDVPRQQAELCGLAHRIDDGSRGILLTLGASRHELDDADAAGAWTFGDLTPAKALRIGVAQEHLHEPLSARSELEPVQPR